MSEKECSLDNDQKQLLFLARAILCKNKIVIYEESPSVNELTDTLIKRKLISHLRGSTVLIVSQDPASVINCDRVMVLDQGSCKEFNHPFRLLTKEEEDTEITSSGHFANLVLKSRMSQQLFKIAQKHFIK